MVKVQSLRSLPRPYELDFVQTIPRMNHTEAAGALTSPCSTCSGNARFFPSRPDHCAGILSQLGSASVVASYGLNSSVYTVRPHTGEDSVHKKQMPRLVATKGKGEGSTLKSCLLCTTASMKHTTISFRFFRMNLYFL